MGPQASQPPGRWKRASWLVCIGVAVCLLSRQAGGHEEVDTQIRELADRIAKDPTNAQHYHKRGRLHAAAGRTELAFADFRRAQAYNPKLHVVALSLSLIHI